MSDKDDTTQGGDGKRGDSQQQVVNQEQALADLDQSIADREQARTDTDQAAIDFDRDQLEAERASAADPVEFARSVNFTHWQAKLDRRQAGTDGRQDQLEQAQTGGDHRQERLDGQQHSLGGPERSEPPTAAQVSADSAARRDATAERAKNARRRAHDALARADAAERRAKALHKRDDPAT